ncbi:MAG: L-ribulose-5-phosphate 4-epimerase [Lactobacillaceae bacterium]|jgi:L-ribulose-5-phosphate 4-epimerase|nr:L-ribulose-5-phosphate 4-epimerase [Lactobacillaceae bacterium]
MYEELKQRVYDANMRLPQEGLVTLTWGNVSEVDRENGVFAIKPSGVPYSELKPEQIVILDLDGNVVEGDLNPSSDTPTHAYLYRTWPEVGGIVHTHSKWAVVYAQSGLPLVAAGTTHADTFYGDVPVAEKLTEEQVNGEYELETGKSIVKAFEDKGIKPLDVPAVLTNDHGPFSWGKNAKSAVDNAIVLEVVADMNYHTQLLLGRDADISIAQYLLDKHYLRKHGPNAYYGQKG